MAFSKNTYRSLVSYVHPDKGNWPQDGDQEKWHAVATWLSAGVNKAMDGQNEAELGRIKAQMEAGTLWTWAWDAFYASETAKEETETKAKAKPKLDAAILADLAALVDSKGWTRAKAAAWLLMEHDIGGATAKAYLDEVFKKRANTRGYAEKMFDRLIQSPMGAEEFETWIKQQSPSVQTQRRGRWEAIVKMANAIHAKA